MLRKLIILFLTALGMLLVAPAGAFPEAKADVMQCPYPATGLQVIVQPVFGAATGYVCDYPTERNLAHLHAEFGGYMLGGSLSGTGIPTGAGVPGVRSLTVGIGLTMWSQSWRCPDERYIAAPPNGIGAWKDSQDFKGLKCPAVSRAPLALDAPWPPVDPNIVFVVNQILPPGEPDPTAAPPPADVPAPPPPAGTPPGPAPGNGGVNTNPVPTDPVPTEPNGS